MWPNCPYFSQSPTDLEPEEICDPGGVEFPQRNTEVLRANRERFGSDGASGEAELRIRWDSRGRIDAGPVNPALKKSALGAREHPHGAAVGTRVASCPCPAPQRRSSCCQPHLRPIVGFSVDNFMPTVSFVSIQCQLLSYENGLTSGECPKCTQNSRPRVGREVWMVPLLSAHDAPLRMSGLSIEACAMASWSEQKRRSGLLPLR